MLELASSETLHRRKLEELTTLANIQTQSKAMDIERLRSEHLARSDMVGQIAGLLVSLICIGGAIYLAMQEKVIIAGAISVIPSAAVIQAFVARKELSRAKAKETPSK